LWHMITERLPDMTVYLTTVIAFILPYSIYKINDKLHERGDPPWKKDEEQDRGNN